MRRDRFCVKCYVVTLYEKSMVAHDLKCPQCGMNKFKKEAKMIKIADFNAVVFICSICGNIMFNANPPTKFKGRKVKDTKITK